jgi:hypothetical protein
MIVMILAKPAKSPPRSPAKAETTPNRAARRAKKVRTTRTATVAKTAATAATASAPRSASMTPRSHETVTVKAETLAATPHKMLTFLQATSKHPHLMAVLAPRGFTQAERDRGWRLLQKVSGYRDPGEIAPSQTPQETHKKLEDWIDVNLAIFALSLRHRHPDQYAVVFAEPAPSKAEGVVVAATKFLDRVESLEADAQSPDNLAAVATLRARGLTDDERASIRALCRDARNGDPSAASIQGAAQTARTTEAMYLYEARAWYEEWAGIARKLIERRSDLILLGLARRKSGKTAAGDDANHAEDDTEEGEGSPI